MVGTEELKEMLTSLLSKTIETLEFKLRIHYPL